MAVKSITTNESLKFSDLSNERFRTYIFENGDALRLDEPLALNVSASGGHRVALKDGRSYYISPKWIAIEWVSDNTYFEF